MSSDIDTPWALLDINILVMCVVFSFTVGANNAASSWSTAYSTRSLTLSKAVSGVSNNDVAGAGDGVRDNRGDVLAGWD
jgi:phosphate/sulfate permease